MKGSRPPKTKRLSNTQVSDAGLVHLKGLSGLGFLDLDQTQVTVGGVQELGQALPNCNIELRTAPDAYSCGE